MIQIKNTLQLLMVVSILMCWCKNNTIQDVISDYKLRNRVISRLSDGELYNLSHCNHAFKNALSKELCGRAKDMIFDTMSQLRSSFQPLQYYQLFGQQSSNQLFDDFNVYVELYMTDETMGPDDTVYAIFSAIYRPLSVKPGYTLYDHERVLLVNNAKEFIMNNCNNMHGSADFELNQKYLTVFVENSETVNDLYDEWTIIRQRFKLVHRRYLYTKLVNAWNDILMVVKKDVLKVIINAQHNNTMDIQFYYNEPWILLLKYISRCSQWFKRKIFSHICRFNQLSSDLIRSAKIRFNFHFTPNAQMKICEIGDKLINLMQDMPQNTAKKAVRNFLNIEVMDSSEQGEPYGATSAEQPELNFYRFFDAHHFIICLLRAIHNEKRNRDLITSNQMALNFELLKMNKLDAVYRVVAEHYQQQKQNNTNASLDTQATSERMTCRNACRLCLCWTGISCFVLFVIGCVWIGVWSRTD